MAAPSIAVLCVAFDGNLVCWLPGGCLAPFLGISSWLVAIAFRLGAAGMRMVWVLTPGRLRSAITPPQALIPGMAGASAFYVPIDAVIVSQPGGRSLGNAKSSR